MLPRPRRILLLAFAVLLLAAAPAAAGGLVQVDGATLRFTGDDLEPSSVTIDDAGGMLVLDDDASRMTAGPGCVASVDGYEVQCPDAGVQQIDVSVGLLGSDVRIRADLPAHIQGGPGDDVLVGGPADDVIDGGAGQDVIAGGGGADALSGGPGVDLVTYDDVIARDGTLLPRRGPVTVAIGRPGASGARGEGDTIARDVEQVQGASGDDTFDLRDGLATEVDCGAGRDTVVADPRDIIDTNCESAGVAPQRGGRAMTVPTLPFPFPAAGDRGVSSIAVGPLLPLRRGTILLRVTCPAGTGLLELVNSRPCSGRVRFTRFDGVAMGTQRVRMSRGRTVTLRLPLTGSRALARRAAGLPITVTGLPDWGRITRTLRFRVRG
ncbi:MAG TPA: calcium-binding protein [Conexibacter sp.]|nr:calcium-binding protein [Conexibacter sp.]